MTAVNSPQERRYYLQVTAEQLALTAAARAVPLEKIKPEAARMAWVSIAEAIFQEYGQQKWDARCVLGNHCLMDSIFQLRSAHTIYGSGPNNLLARMFHIELSKDKGPLTPERRNYVLSNFARMSIDCVTGMQADHEIATNSPVGSSQPDKRYRSIPLKPISRNGVKDTVELESEFVMAEDAAKELAGNLSKVWRNHDQRNFISVALASFLIPPLCEIVKNYVASSSFEFEAYETKLNNALLLTPAQIADSAIQFSPIQEEEDKKSEDYKPQITSKPIVEARVNAFMQTSLIELFCLATSQTIHGRYALTQENFDNALKHRYTQATEAEKKEFTKPDYIVHPPRLKCSLRINALFTDHVYVAGREFISFNIEELVEAPKQAGEQSPVRKTFLTQTTLNPTWPYRYVEPFQRSVVVNDQKETEANKKAVEAAALLDNSLGTPVANAGQTHAQLRVLVQRYQESGSANSGVGSSLQAIWNSVRGVLQSDSAQVAKHGSGPSSQ